MNEEKQTPQSPAPVEPTPIPMPMPSKPPKPKPAPVVINEAQKAAILSMTSRKHVKIWLLHSLGMNGKDIATATGTNAGHVGNVVRDYNDHPAKVAAAAMPAIVEGK